MRSRLLGVATGEIGTFEKFSYFACDNLNEKKRKRKLETNPRVANRAREVVVANAESLFARSKIVDAPRGLCVARGSYVLSLSLSLANVLLDSGGMIVAPRV